MNFKIVIMLILITILLGCTQKNNPVGYEPVGEPKYIELRDDIISNTYSYEDTVKYYKNATEISLGNRGKYESKVLLRFLTLPDSLAEIENDDITLKICMHKQTGVFSDNIAIGIMNQYWNQNYVTWKTASDTIDWDGEYYNETSFEISEFGEEYTSGDTIEIPLPIDLFYEQIDNKYYADTLVADHGIILMQKTPDYNSEVIFEFYSNEAIEELQPSLSFNYKTESSDEEYTEWTSATIYDGMLYNSTDNDLETFDIYADSLIFRNISPTRMFLGLNIGLENFISDEDTTGIYTQADLNRISINKAELVLHAKPGYYLSSKTLYMIPYFMTDSSYVSTPETDNIPVYEDQYEWVSGTSSTSDSLNSEEISIEITEIVQSYLVNGDGMDGYGLVIFSSRENRDFSRVSFYNQEAEEESFRPYIKLYYTPPLLP